MRLVPLVALVSLVAAPLPAQEPEQNGERPSDWQVRFDRPAPDSALYFVTMDPGWHITTGPSGIMYNPATTGEGDFRVESEIFLFPGQMREAFGIFVGGEDLQAPNQSYLYFLIRGDGHYLVKHRAGSETHTLVPWTAHDSVTKHDGGDGTAQNVLAIEADGEEVRFIVNGTEVATLPRAPMNVDGVVGLRVNHNLNLHVSKLEVEQIR